MTTEEELWALSDHLVEIAHVPLVEPGRKFTQVDKRLFAAGLVGRTG